MSQNSAYFIKGCSPSGCLLAVRLDAQVLKTGTRHTLAAVGPLEKRSYTTKILFLPPIVQRSVSDPSLLVATYEGRHNHKSPSEDEVSIELSTAATEITSSSSISKSMVEQMASTITRNPSFTAALAAAVIERILDHEKEEN
ncbi:probable WRKY transcription factor 60 [Olea europaea var. sylvestris]|uniref:probable WRKY transcription factor 60 n=1 Tax=Olea europaea var. sylvestris TaxID=158386 RepID=UPI000C1D0838|nr:probable WRKY transcription factor 60 [Olea europaea var. sylvestris]